ncbi:MAG TPA: hypothetical protein DDX84_05685 [Nitrospiraceae bacterium]|nr:hypothetical protein [Nitrospiraceae bacterium]
MDYFVLARKVDESGVMAHIDSHPDGMPIKKYEFFKGISLKNRFPENPEYHFSLDEPGGRKLVDLHSNRMGILIISKKFKEIISNETNLEFLPIKLINHRKKVASVDYTIANIVGLLDCMDSAQSIGRQDPFFPDRFSRINKLVIDEKKVPDGINIFRLKQSPSTVIIKRVLKEKIEAVGLEGHLCVPIEEFDSAYYIGV